MQEATMRNTCPVCGYGLNRPPEDFVICPSCGTEFGYDDSGTSHEELRQRWIATGPAWWSTVDQQPANWNPYQQLYFGLFSGSIPNVVQSTGIEGRS